MALFLTSTNQINIKKMKKLIKLTFLGAVLIASTSIFAQESAKKEKKQEPKKEKQVTTTTKKDAATDTTKKGGTRMAINEQGIPNKKNKSKTASTASPKTESTTKDK